MASNPSSNSVVHIITGLNDGGAEGALYRLCHHDLQTTHVVISLMDSGKYGPRLEAAGIRVFCLGLPRGKVTVRALFSLWRLLRKIRPTVVQTWLYHADLIGGLVARFAGVPKVVWGIRNTNLMPGTVKRGTIRVAKLCAWLSGWVPTLIVSCSERAMAAHVALGYAEAKFRVVPNGFNLAQLRPSTCARDRVREKLGVGEGQFLIGMVARFDPQKDHLNLIKALSLVISECPELRCVLVGTNVDPSNAQLKEWISNLGCQNEIVLLGRRDDVPEIMSALDLHVLSSLGEAFPNVLAEAMACGTPCVTTDVGDASLIVGDTGWVVPPRNHEALARAILDARAAKREASQWSERQRAARLRIESCFSVERMVDSYRALWFGFSH